MVRRSFEFLLRKRFALLLLGTAIALLVWQHLGMEKRLVFDPRTAGIEGRVLDDSGEGGRSICSVRQESDRWVLEYDIRPGGTWAFCGMELRLPGASQGRYFDLSGYDSMVVTLGHITGPNRSMQASIKVMEPSVFRPGVGSSLKYHTSILFPTSRDFSRNVLPIKNMNVPTWWVTKFEVTVEHQNRDLSKAVELELLTSAEHVQFGAGSIEIRSVELQGKWIRSALLARILLVTGLAWVLLSLAYRLYRALASASVLRQRTQDLEDVAGRDPLTGALNRRGLDDALFVLSTSRLELSLGVILLDLDHFKQVNDSYGHEVGDLVLQAISNVIQRHLRDGNLVVRWGGEEFVLVFANIPLGRLRVVAEEIRKDVEESVKWQDHRVTVSLGLAIGPAKSFPETVNRADAAMYKAKASGRNRVAEAE